MAELPESQAQLQQLYEAQPGLDDLAARVEQVESAGRQDAVSSKGAVGVMQVMPTTAPEAAAFAGVEFDDELYRTDEAYNRLLGTAYLAKMLEQFDGNQAHALAAYNAGPTAVRKALVRGRNWLSGLPAETQDYVQKILG
jgi:soluble lytic murein transglycosylase